MATTSTINHQDIHQPGGVGVTLQQMTNCTSSVDSDSAKSSLCSDAEDLIFFHTQSNPIMDFLLEGDTASSRESLVNLLDEGLGTSLDGTEELCAAHPTLGRNDSGVFSSDETAVGIPRNRHLSKPLTSPTSVSQPKVILSSSTGIISSTQTSSSVPVPVQVQQQKKSSRPKNASPNRQGPQRCAVCSKEFSTQSALTKHKLTHSDERKHTCTVCSKAFKRQDHLNGHMLTHRSKKPFECAADNCGKSYCDARSLKRHIESRHGPEVLATMTIAPTPHSDSDFSIIIPSTNSASGAKNAGKNGKRSTSGKKSALTKNQKSNVTPTPPSSNPLLCQGSNSSPEEEAVEENELLTSVENLLSLEESSSASVSENVAVAAALLEESLMEMGVIEEDVDMDIDQMDISSSSEITHMGDKLNNNKIGNPHECNSSTVGLINEKSESTPVEKSHLHGLLTQRSLTSGGIRKFTDSDVDAAAVTLIKESLIASVNGHQQEMGKIRGIMGGDLNGGVLLKYPSSPPQINSPHSLKEQLELIHQIIQQTTEESVVKFTTGANKNTNGSTSGLINSKPSAPVAALVVLNKKVGNTSQSLSVAATSLSSNEEKVDFLCGDEVNGLGQSLSGGGIKGDDKPVECAICLRRFRNTPALNGHMRLHGGYFKKESDGKKKETAAKESQGAPLQTASVSVRALIEEKIIQRRNTQQGDKSSASSSSANTPKTSPSSSAPTTPTKVAAPVQSPSSMLSSVGINNGYLMDVGSKGNIFVNNSQSFSFDEAHAEYLLIEEEVFNKVSSICPDSFFSGIEESILCESGIGTGSDSSHISTDFLNWSTTASGNENNAFFHGPATPSMTLSNSGSSSCGNDNPFTPLPPMDPVFFTPTPGSSHSQQSQSCEDLADSPSFIYPTPPASLESHNALQSPLFPYPYPFEASPTAAGHNLLVNPAHSQQLLIKGQQSAPTSSTATFLTNSPNSIGASSNYLLTSTQGQYLVGVGGAGATGGKQGIFLLNGNQSIQAPISSSIEIKSSPALPSPPSISPSSVTTSLFGQTPSQSQGNEPCPIIEEAQEALQNSNRIFAVNLLPDPFVPKQPKRKALRNTLASNLRPQLVQSPSYYTPYPILSPVRSAPGLYWTFSGKLSHVDEFRKNVRRGRINVGPSFQAVIPAFREKTEAVFNDASKWKKCEDLLWSPDSTICCFEGDVEKYLEFACCSAIPYGGRNNEYALHILNFCNGDINAAMLVLMNPEPKLPSHLVNYHYPEREKWTKSEILKFQDSILRHGKDFLEVSKELGTKSGEACVSFYRTWKKVCPDEYEKIRSIWKKRDAAFTIELLKTIPKPQATLTQTKPATEVSGAVVADKMGKQVKPQQQSPASSRGHGLNDEFPCKICGKIFSKVKSRSAHMKSHRPPPTPPSNSPAPVLSPASAATIMENKEKIADALQKHIFGKKSQQGNSPNPKPVVPFMPKIVKVNSLTQTQKLAIASTSKTCSTSSIQQQSIPISSSTQCFQTITQTSAHPLQTLQLQAT